MQAHKQSPKKDGADRVQRDIDQVTTDKERKIVLYCAGGFRSALAALNLKKMGFNNVISLNGGYRGWVQSQGG